MPTEELVDQIVRLAFEQAAPEIKTIVVHWWPDDDALLCLWTAKKFIPKAANARIVFVNAGESLPGSEGDPSVIHFDTGGGEYDQHGKGIRNTSSAAILAEKLGLTDNGLKPLIELATAVDNIKPMPPTSIHFIIKGYPRMFKKPDGTTDWLIVQERIFELFDIIYNQETARGRSRNDFRKHAERIILPNGINIAILLWHPECREEAFNQGAAVVIWTQSRGPHKFYTGIQCNRMCPDLWLDRVAVALRFAEAQARGLDVRGKNLTYLGRGEPVPVWYLHDSLRLILNGSRSWKLSEDEYTKLQPRQIVGLVSQALAAITPEVVSG